MKCVSCSRPLTTPTVQINTKAGALAWGPVCARRAGLLDKLPRARRAITRSRAADLEADTDQLTLELTP